MVDYCKEQHDFEYNLVLISTTTFFKDKVVVEKFTSTYLHQSAREIMLPLVNNSHEERVTKRSPIRSVIILMTNKIGQLRSGSPICQSRV